MTKIYAILKLIRWYNCLISVLVVIVAAWLLPDYPPVNFMILACLIIFFITAFGNIHNDVIDIEADNINHPERPLPQGLLSPETASLIGTLFMLVGLSLAFLLSMKIFIVACLAAILLYLYNSFLKRIPLLSNITVAVLGALAFIFSGFLSSEYHLFEFSLINAGAVFAFWFHLGREIIKDLEDYKGDSKYGVKTLANSYPTVLSKIISTISFVFIFITAGLVYFFLKHNLHFVVLFVLGTALPIGIILITLWRSGTEKSYKIISIALKVIMPLGLLALAAVKF